MNNFLAQHPINTTIPVAWGEMDALQHVNNAVYFKYFETARLDFFNQINLLADLKTTGVGPVLSETNARFKRPLTFPDTIIVGTKISDITEDRFVMHYTVFSQAQQAVTTIGWAKVVMFNVKTGQKAKLTPQLLDALSKHQ
ncbi:acyl-CoA thioesterase [Shewanella basaltis]|uniref:acyl-CoA thioesterase n=1 Tax=Shewanella basaltis TaxID=472183 RepID=UPI003AAED3E5